MLPSEIIDIFERAIIEDGFPGAPMEAFKLFSAHDNTIMALLAFMGIVDFTIPNFAAFVAFELHKRGEQWLVKIIYNPNPDTYKVPGFGYANDRVMKHEAKYFRLPENPLFGVKTDELIDGSDGMFFCDFKENIMEMRGAYPNDEAWEEDGKAQKDEDDTPNKKSFKKAASSVRAVLKFKRKTQYADVSMEEDDEVDTATYIGVGIQSGTYEALPGFDRSDSSLSGQSPPGFDRVDSSFSLESGPGASPAMPTRVPSIAEEAST